MMKKILFFVTIVLGVNVLNAQVKEREAIQHKINELSIASAEYAIPNETDLILTRIGGNKINAVTSYDHTIYYNNFPSNQIGKWMDVYVERC